MSTYYAYYNEHDAYAAQWLRNLIKAGHITDGEVDERSIEDVAPDDVKGFRRAHWFAGIGVWDYALNRAGWGDGEVWSGSCPCQPFSVAGKGDGFNDERHLWPAFHWLIEQRRPLVVFGEQVASEDGLAWLDGVCTDLEGKGYTVGTIDTCAAGVGAPHIRQRIYWVGHTGDEGLGGHGRDGTKAGNTEAVGPDTPASDGGTGPAGVDALPVLRRVGMHDTRGTRSRLRLPADRGLGDGPLWSRFESLACSDGWRRVRPGTFPLVNGAAARVGRLRAYGNAICAPQAEEFIKAYLEVRP